MQEFAAQKWFSNYPSTYSFTSALITIHKYRSWCRFPPSLFLATGFWFFTFNCRIQCYTAIYSSSPTLSLSYLLFTEIIASRNFVDKLDSLTRLWVECMFIDPFGRILFVKCLSGRVMFSYTCGGLYVK